MQFGEGVGGGSRRCLMVVPASSEAPSNDAARAKLEHRRDVMALSRGQIR